MRNLGKADSLKQTAAGQNASIKLKQLDVNKEESIKNVVKEILEAEGRIDVLINNAGFSSPKTIEQSTIQEFREIFETNFFGPATLIQQVVPGMRERREGHIITLGSIGGLMGQPFNDAYCAAKFAVEGLSEAMATTLAHFNIKVSVIEPGPIKTNFIENTNAFGGNPAAKDTTDPYYPYVAAYFKSVTARFRSADGDTSQTGDEVATFIIEEVIENPNPHFRNPTSKAVHASIAKKFVTSDGDDHVKAIIERNFDFSGTFL